MSKQGTLRTCKKGHEFYKSSDCPTCPICEKQKEPKQDFLAKISAPARRAFERENILTLKKLSEYSEKEILGLHGVGPSAIPKLNEALKTARLAFRKE